jgi:arginine N-succinyltransferase
MTSLILLVVYLENEIFVIRSAHINDLEDLFSLSELMNFINLPRDKTKLIEKLHLSKKSFEDPTANPTRNEFIFVLENQTKNEVIGVSIINGKHGTEQEPHFYLSVGRENKYSSSLNTGFIHGTLKFGYTTDGFTEIGGLVLHPDYRGSSLKLGKALSFARFLFIGTNKELFTDSIHVELMPPLDSKGNSPLWEAVGRRFLNMDYLDADKLSRQNKEFIFSLFPSEVIYEALLPLEARDAIGKVNELTEPVKRMLGNAGFQYTEEVDPFDGGPHFRAKKEDIKPIQEITEYQIQDVQSTTLESSKTRPFLYHVGHSDHPFYCNLSLASLVSKNKVEIIAHSNSNKTNSKSKGFFY